MSWADFGASLGGAASSAAEFAGRSLCRPGWVELAVVLVLILGASAVGCCCGVGWGIALCALGGSPPPPVSTGIARVVTAAARKRLAGYTD